MLELQPEHHSGHSIHNRSADASVAVLQPIPTDVLECHLGLVEIP